MSLTVTLTKDGNDVWGRTRVQHASLALDNSYPTGGYSLPATKFGMRALFNMLIGDMGVSGTGGYRFAWDSVNSKLMVYRVPGFTPAGSGTAAAQTFTGTAPLSDLNLATPVFSGTGYATSSQVITTTDNQTMTLNQCAGMWFVPPSGAKPNVLILSNTAVTGAPAVLTVQGVAPTTDAGAYKIVTGPAPAGTNGTSAVTFTGTAVAAGALVQVSNGVDLSAITALYVTALGR
jgi:hypothetical protein